jgi:SAM-dependent methyltransferase
VKVRIENGIVIGTSGGKYAASNPIARYLIRRFDRAVADLATVADPSNILEIGCGEGHVTQVLLEATRANIVATDISATMIAEASRAIRSSRVSYRQLDITTFEPLEPAPDLIVCCEVLEHLCSPALGLRTLWAQRASWYLMSVPREPVFRGMNFARAAYLRSFGNSPGHVQHWSKRGFLDLVSQAFEPVIVRSPIPWTVVLCRPRSSCA